MTHGQSRKASAIESALNVLIGYWIAILAQILIFPMFGLRPSFAENLAIGGLFTIVSMVRSYALRRFFNWLHVRGNQSQLRHGAAPEVKE